MKAVGLNTLIADLAGAGIAVVPRATEVVHDVAHNIEGTGKQFVPVDEGETRDSIGVDEYPLAAVIGPTTYWAHFVENGTVYMAPQAFMGPALDRHSHELEVGIARVAGL